MAMEFSNTLMEVYTMDSSEMIRKMDTDTWSSVTTTSMTANGCTTSNMEKEFLKMEQLEKFRKHAIIMVMK